jgi:hypothetical protein
MTAAIRWSTFLLITLAALAFLVSIPVVAAVWQGNISQLMKLDIPERLLQDTLKAIVYIGLLTGPIPAGFAAVKGNKGKSKKIWMVLSVFYAFCSLIFFFPFDVNKRIADGMTLIGFFMIFISLLSLLSWFYTNPRINK